MSRSKVGEYIQKENIRWGIMVLLILFITISYISVTAFLQIVSSQDLDSIVDNPEIGILTSTISWFILAVSFIVLQLSERKEDDKIVSIWPLSIKSEDRKQWIGANLSLFLILQIASIATIFYQQQQLIIFLFYCGINLVWYTLLASLDALPTNKPAFWGSISLIGTISAILLILLQLPNLPNLTIEIVGAFIGILIAISLGEFLKGLEELNFGRNLIFDILHELKNVEESLLDNSKEQQPIPIWNSAVANGRILLLPQNHRNLLTKVYHEIHLFNEHRFDEFRERSLNRISEFIDAL